MFVNFTPISLWTHNWTNSLSLSLSLSLSVCVCVCVLCVSLSLFLLGDEKMFHRFDNFNSAYSPFGVSGLRKIFMKSENAMGGKYFAELTKQVGSADQCFIFVLFLFVF